MQDSTFGGTVWAFEYELPNIELVLTCMIHAEEQRDAIAEFRRRRPHGKIKKINGERVKDDGYVISRREKK